MVSLMIKNPDLPTGYEVVNTSWYLARDKEFTDIVVESVENTVNKFNIQFNIELKLGVKYYAKSRVVYNKGFSNYSNINVFIAKDLNEIELDLYAPTKISRPDITITPVEVEKPIALLEFSGGDFISKYNILQKSATYILEDITGKVVWSKINDSTNLNSIVLPIALQENSAYRLMIAYEGKNNNTSQFAIETFVTGKNDINVNNTISAVPSGIDLTFSTDIVEYGLASTEFKLYAEGGFLVDSKTIMAVDGIDMTSWTVNGDLLQENVNYTLFIKTTDSSSLSKTGYFYFKPYFDSSVTPDVNFKYTNTVSSFVPNYTLEMFATATGYRPALPNQELIQSSGKNGVVILNFFKFVFDTKKFNFTGRSFKLGNLFGIGSNISMDDFSYTLLKSGKLVIKCLNRDLVITVPYNVISGDIDTNLLKTRTISPLSTSKATTTHGIVDVSKIEFITYSMLETRLLLVNANDLSYSYLNSKMYSNNPEYLAIYKISSSLMLIVDIAPDGLSATFDIYNFVTNLYVVEDEVINTLNINLISNFSTTLKVAALYNGDILCMFKSTTVDNTEYRVLVVNEENNSANLNYLMVDANYIDQGVYSLLRNGKVVELSSTKGLIFE